MEVKGLRIGIASILFSAAAGSQEVPTARASRTSDSIKIDGKLTEAAWLVPETCSGLVQREPFVGEPATKKTEFRVLYDDKSIYVAVISNDNEPDKIIRRTRRFDSTQIFRDDYVSVNFDPTRDRRTVYSFSVNPLGTIIDQKAIDNGVQVLSEWDTIWEAGAVVDDRGWTVEFRIPFTSLDFDPNQNVAIGLNVTRQIARTKEVVDWAPISLPFSSYQASSYGILIGIETKDHGWRRLKLFPFFSTGFRQNESSIPSSGLDAGETEFVHKPGLDLKYPLARSAILQATVNTDFSQVDIDNQQINLNRFNLFYPERRSFFLEGAEFFDFGISQEAQLFFSRRIGLEENEEIPIFGGVRSYGSFDGTKYGILNMQTNNTVTSSGTIVPGRNFTIGRLRQSILSHSDAGSMVTHRQDTNEGDGSNTAVGLDATFRSDDGRLRAKQWVAGTHSEAGSGSTNAVSGDGSAAYQNSEWWSGLWYLGQSNLFISDTFNPDSGFLFRNGIFRSTLEVNKTFRLAKRNIDRLIFGGFGEAFLNDEFTEALDYAYQGAVTLRTNNNFTLESIGFRTSDKVIEAFNLNPTVTVPPGRYTENGLNVLLLTPNQYVVSGGLKYWYGGFFGGTIHQVSPSLAFRPQGRLSFDTNAVINLINIPSLNADYTATTLNFSGSFMLLSTMYLDANAAWNQDDDTINLQYRYRWRFRPLSNFFAVYSEERTASTFMTRFRGLLLKVVVYFDI